MSSTFCLVVSTQGERVRSKSRTGLTSEMVAMHRLARLWQTACDLTFTPASAGLKLHSQAPYALTRRVAHQGNRAALLSYPR